jgi:hypothetical protein
LTRLKKELDQIKQLLQSKAIDLQHWQKIDKKNREEYARDMAMVNNFDNYVKGLQDREKQREVKWTDTFYEPDGHQPQEPEATAVSPNPIVYPDDDNNVVVVSDETKKLMAKRKEKRVAFKKSPLFTKLTNSQQQKYRELDFEDQDIIHDCNTITEVRNHLKEMVIV